MAGVQPKGNTFAYCLSLQYLIRFRGEVNRMVNEELLFRGLPWGINIDEARALLNLPDLESLQLKDAVSSQYSVYGFQGHRVAASANSHYKNKGLVHQLWRWYSDEDSRPRIAEKMLEAIYLFFANVPKGNKLSYSDSDTCLYAATYYFAPERESFAKDAAYIPVVKTADGLIEKLSLLYGAPDKVDAAIPYTDGAYTYHSAVTHWFGKNDTEIALSAVTMDEFAANELQHVEISYVWHGGDAVLQAADNATDPSSKIYKRLFLGCNGL